MECPFSAIAGHVTDDGPSGPDIDEPDELPIPVPLAVPERKKVKPRPIEDIMDDIMDEIERLPVPSGVPATAPKGTEPDPFGGVVARVTRPLPKAAVVPKPVTVRAPSPVRAPVRLPVREAAAVKAVRVGFRATIPRTRESFEGKIQRTAKVEEATSRAFEQTARQGRFPTRKVAGTVAAVATGGAAFQALRSRPFTGGRGGFFFNQASQMRRLVGQSR